MVFYKGDTVFFFTLNKKGVKKKKTLKLSPEI
jgi:hypothetical protein